MSFKDAATFGPSLTSEAIDVLYLCPGLEANLAEIIGRSPASVRW